MGDTFNYVQVSVEEYVKRLYREYKKRKISYKEYVLKKTIAQRRQNMRVNIKRYLDLVGKDSPEAKKCLATSRLDTSSCSANIH